MSNGNNSHAEKLSQYNKRVGIAKVLTNKAIFEQSSEGSKE